MNDWHDSQPIYLQVRERVVQRILYGTLAEGDAVPSVRQVSAEEKINPITVSKAYQMLADEGLVEKRRGLGMFVTKGARSRALEQERAQFLEHEWPLITKRIESLGLSTSDLLAGGAR